MEIEIVCHYDELVDPKKLKNHPKNRNHHPQEQIERFAKMLEYHKWRKPIEVSRRSGYICCGHGRKLVALRVGMEKVPIVYQDFESDEAEYAYVQADNALALWAELDLSGINTDLADLGPDFDIDMLGLKDFKLDLNEEFDGNSDPDEVPEDVPTKAKLGDLFILGEHKILCGDSTSESDLEHLFGGERAALFLTDPPYGVSYTAKNEYLNSLGKPMACPKAIQNDEKTPEEMFEFWLKIFGNGYKFSSDKMSYYITAPQGGDLLLLLQSVRQSGFQLKHILVWAKNNHVLGRCDYHYKHEPIVYGWKQGFTHEFYGKGKFNTSVWEIDKPLKNDLHPTMKPVELWKEIILNSAKQGDIVLDLFSGSGTILIACEETKTKARTIEIDPHYIDVAIARWQKFTCKQAVREDGVLWDDIETNNKQNNVVG